MEKNYVKRVLVALVVFLAAMPMFAADGTSWSAGKIQTILQGGEVDNAAGMVFASPVALTSADEIAAVEGVFQADPVSVTGNLYGPDTNKEWFFYVKPNAGYKFVGFVSSATGTPSGSNLAEKLNMLGDYYTVSAKTGSPYKEYAQDAPKVLTRYAVFEKDATVDPGEGGEGGEDPVLTNIKAIGAKYAKVVAVTDGENTTGVAQYVNLVGETLVANGTENSTQGDQVTHIYVQFDAELANIGMSASQALSQVLSLVNTTTGQKIHFSQYGCAVWSKDNTHLDLMISSEDWINSLDYQGVYVFKLPAGVVKSAKGAVNDAYEFTFTYGNPEEAVIPEPINLDEYLGNWKQKRDVGEQVENPGAFSFEKIGDNYYMTNLYASSLAIPLSVNDGDYSFANTTSTTESFVSSIGSSVVAKFQKDSGKNIIYLDQFTIKSDSHAQSIVGGGCFFEKTTGSIPTGINTVEDHSAMNQIFDLQGRRLSQTVKGINIIGGKKIVVK